MLRHWWILAKLLLTTTATFILLTHMRAVSRMSHIAADMGWGGAGFRELRVQLVIHAAGGSLVLLAITAISVFKPWGLTPFGRRRVEPLDLTPQQEEFDAASGPAFPTSTPRWMRIVGYHAIALFLLFVIFHIAGGGLGHHGH